jgi:hypothetical protein
MVTGIIMLTSAQIIRASEKSVRVFIPIKKRKKMPKVHLEEIVYVRFLRCWKQKSCKVPANDNSSTVPAQKE